MATINTIKENYNKHDDIAKELDNVKLENFLDFDNNGGYEFAHCGTCGGPLLGHLEAKCSHLDNVRYDGILVKGFEDWLKSIKGFREAVAERNRRKEKEKNAERVVEIRETVKTIIENMERKGTDHVNSQTTQLVKS